MNKIVKIKDLREDKAKKSPDADKFLKEAKNIKNRYYVVPLVIE